MRMYKEGKKDKIMHRGKKDNMFEVYVPTCSSMCVMFRYPQKVIVIQLKYCKYFLCLGPGFKTPRCCQRNWLCSQSIYLSLCLFQPCAEWGFSSTVWKTASWQVTVTAVCVFCGEYHKAALLFQGRLAYWTTWREHTNRLKCKSRRALFHSVSFSATYGYALFKLNIMGKQV